MPRYKLSAILSTMPKGLMLVECIAFVNRDCGHATEGPKATIPCPDNTYSLSEILEELKHQDYTIKAPPRCGVQEVSQKEARHN